MLSKLEAVAGEYRWDKPAVPAGGWNVAAQVQYSATLPASCDPRLRRLYDYWRAIHPHSGGLPGRQHFDPTAVPELLAHLWLVDVHRNPLRFKVRLAGTESVAIMEHDYTGAWIDEAFPSFVPSLAYPQFVAAAERGEIAYRRGKPVFHIKKDYLSMERVLLPLARNGRDVDILLAITVYHRHE